LASDSCFALNSAHLISQTQKHYWQIEDRLPYNYVTAIAHGRRLLVIGIQEGLARFDGVRFSPAASIRRSDRRWFCHHGFLFDLCGSEFLPAGGGILQARIGTGSVHGDFLLDHRLRLKSAAICQSRASSTEMEAVRGRTPFFVTLISVWPRTIGVMPIPSRSVRRVTWLKATVAPGTGG